MSLDLDLDKVTVANVTAAVIISGYVVFSLVYPELTPPQSFTNLLMIAAGYLFSVEGIRLGYTILKRALKA